MSTEAVRTHDQGPLSQAIGKLRAKNAEVGGILFSTVGKGLKEAFLFPTPVTRQEEGITVDEFLVATISRGFRAIQIERVRHIEVLRDRVIYVRDISDYITEKLGKKPGIFASDGYNPEHDELRLHLGNEANGINVDRYGAYTQRILTFDFDNIKIKNCRLVEADGAKVEEILTANIKRVETTRATSQRASDVLSGAALVKTLV